jgi:uncharacterized protein (DUF2267 family)
MPVPAEYERASDQFYKLLIDARDSAGLGSTHQAYTMVQGVLQVFRRRLDTRESIRFAATLPPLVRALFVIDWEVDEPRRGFEDRADMTREVQSLRAAHNFAPDTAIKDVARSLKGYVDEAEFDRILATLPDGAIEFWET